MLCLSHRRCASATAHAMAVRQHRSTATAQEHSRRRRARRRQHKRTTGDAPTQSDARRVAQRVRLAAGATADESSKARLHHQGDGCAGQRARCNSRAHHGLLASAAHSPAAALRAMHPHQDEHHCHEGVACTAAVSAPGAAQVAAQTQRYPQGWAANHRQAAVGVEERKSGLASRCRTRRLRLQQRREERVRKERQVRARGGECTSLGEQQVGARPHTSAALVPAGSAARSACRRAVSSASLRAQSAGCVLDRRDASEAGTPSTRQKRSMRAAT